MRFVDCVKPRLMGILCPCILCKGKSTGKKGKSHAWDFPIIVPRFPVMLILNRRKTNGPVTSSWCLAFPFVFVPLFSFYSLTLHMEYMTFCRNLALYSFQPKVSIALSMDGGHLSMHSSVLAWRIPGTGEPGGLSSMGSHRVGHDWSDLAALIYVRILFGGSCKFSV